MSSDKTIMLSGYAPAPRGTSFLNLYGSLGVIMIVDTETDVVIDAEFTFITSLSNDFYGEFMQGIDLKTNIDELAESIRARCWSPVTESLVACVKVAIRRYFDTKKTVSTLFECQLIGASKTSERLKSLGYRTPIEYQS